MGGWVGGSLVGVTPGWVGGYLVGVTRGWVGGSLVGVTRSRMTAVPRPKPSVSSRKLCFQHVTHIAYRATYVANSVTPSTAFT